jgi:hypothetical protein
VVDLRAGSVVRQSFTVALAVVLVLSPIVGFIGLPAGTAHAAAAAPSDGDVVIAEGGDNSSEAIDSDGTSLQHTNLGTSTDAIHAVEGGATFAGNSSDVTKIDSSGSVVWSVSGGTDTMRSVTGPSNGSFVITTNRDGTVQKIQSDGTVSDSLSFSSDQRGADYHNGTAAWASNGGTLWIYDAGSMTETANYSQADGLDAVAFGVNGDYVYVGYFDGSASRLAKIDASSGSSVWDTSISTSATVMIHALAVGDAGNIYISTWDQDFKYDTAGNQIWSNNPAPETGSVAYDSGYVYYGSRSGDLRKYHDDNSGTVFSNSYGASYTKDVAVVPASATAALSGTVETQDGQRAPNATVEIWATSDSLTVPDGSSLKQEQNKLLDQATDPIPERFERDQDYADVATDRDAPQALVHTPSDWLDESSAIASTPGGQIGGAGEGIDTPHQQLTPGQTHIVSCWDLSAGDGVLSDAIDSQWAGVTTDCTVTIERIGPSGDVVHERTLESEEMYETRANLPGVGKRHHAVEWEPQEAGIYRITVEGSPVETWVHAGDLRDLERTFEEDLKDEANQKAERAKELAQLRNDKEFNKITVEANATGHWSADVPDGYSYVAVTARKGTYKGDLLMAGTDPKNRTMGDFRSEWQSVADQSLDDATSTSDPVAAPDVGSVYLSTEPKRVDVPSDGTVVRVREISSPSYTDPSTAENFSQLLDSWLANQSQEELQSLFGADGLNATETEETANRLEAAMQRNEQLQQRIEDSEEDLNSAEERLQFLEQLLVEHGSTAPVENTEQSVGETTDSGDRPVEVTLTYPSERFGDSLAAGNWTVLAHDSTGDERIVPDENVTVDRDRATGTVEITISDTMPADVASTRYEVIGISKSEVTRSSEIVENPDAAGSVPALESIGISSTRPGPDDRVTMTLHPSEDSSFAKISSATVYQPDGSTSPADVSGSEIAFSTNGSGTYAVDVVAENTKGTPYHETFRVHAGSADVDMPPGVRMRDTQFGTVALATDGAQEADVSLSDDRSEATIGVELAEGTDLSDGLHVYSTGALSGNEQTIRVRALDDGGRQLGQSVGVTIHHDDLSQDALIYRNGDPVAGDAKVVHGSNASAATSIQTVTTSDGTVEIEVNRDPSVVDRVSYRVQSTLASISLPSPATASPPPAPSAPMPMLGGLGALALAGDLARRNRGGRQ